MTSALTFSEIFIHSYNKMKPLLRTYILGVLILAAIGFVARMLGFMFFFAGSMAPHSSLAVFIPGVLLAFACLVVVVIAQMLLTVYALVLSIDHKKEVIAGLKKSLRWLWSVLLGGIWVMLRSFAWISFLGVPFVLLGIKHPGFAVIGQLLFIVGMVCGFVFGPRYYFTNIIQISEGMGVRKSAEASFKHTKGYWGKIVGNSLLFAGCIFLSMIALMMVYGLAVGITVALHFAFHNPVITVLFSIPFGIAGIVAAFVYFCGLMLTSRLFMVELYETIKKHPRK